MANVTEGSWKLDIELKSSTKSFDSTWDVC